MVAYGFDKKLVQTRFDSSQPFPRGAQWLSGKIRSLMARASSEAQCCVLEQVNLSSLLSECCFNPGKCPDMTENC